METDAWTLIRFLHVPALAFFVGGQVLLVAAVVPVLRGGEQSTMRAVARRFGVGSLIALAILLATGIVMASPSRWGDDTLNAKLAVLVLAGVLTALHIATPSSRGGVDRRLRLVAAGRMVGRRARPLMARHTPGET